MASPLLIEIGNQSQLLRSPLHARTVRNLYSPRLEIQANLCGSLVCAHKRQPLFIGIGNSSQLLRDPCIRAQSPTATYREWKFKRTCVRSMYARTVANRYLRRLKTQANLCEILVCAHNPQPLFIAIGNSSQLVRDLCMRARSPTVIHRDWKFKPAFATF